MTLGQKIMAAFDILAVFVLVTLLWIMRYELADED